MRRAFTLIEILVVLVIIAILAAILLPALASARRAAHLTACQARLYQLGHAIEIFHNSNGGYPESLQEMVDRGLVNQDMIRCPYPDTAAADFVYILPETLDSTRNVPPGRTVIYCVAHMKASGEGSFTVPLEGEVPYLRYPTATGRVKAKALERYKKVGGSWQTVNETGTVPSYPETWRFPKDPWPPEK